MKNLVKILSGVAAAALAVTGLVLGVGSAQQADAANAANFNPGYIVSDAQFYNDNAMTAAQVQTFLTQKGGNCTNNCLKDYKVTTQSMAATSRCDAYQGKTNQSAAEIIYNVAKACNISQKTLLVLLEKETSLVTIDYPANWRYDRAMGYYCPDDPARPGWCAPQYGGFFNQVYNSAAQYQRYAQSPNSWNYVAGRTNNILYNPSASCGSGPVYIQNQATAALYIYTPYQPNKAALNNLYGTGDSCSAYGNRNFWRLWTDWFGSPTAPITDDEPVVAPSPTPAANKPQATLDSVKVNSDQTVSLRGWAFDADTPNDSIRVHVYVDGKPYKSIAADQARADVNKAYSVLKTDNVGFNYTTNALSAGEHTIKLYAINVGSGSNTVIATKTVTVKAPTSTPKPVVNKPNATLDSVKVNSDQTVSLRGWAFDADTPNDSIRVHVYVDGKPYKSIAADQARADVNKAYSVLNTDDVGFNYTTNALSAGDHAIKLYAINVGSGSNTVIATKTVTVTTPTETPKPVVNKPKATLDSVKVNANQTVSLRGWAFDADTPTSSIRVHIYIDGKGYKSIAADAKRSDVNKAYEVLKTDNVGFNYTTGALAAGEHKITMYAINVGSGSNTVIASQTVTVKAPAATTKPTATPTATPKPTKSATAKPTATATPKPTSTRTPTNSVKRPLTVIPSGFAPSVKDLTVDAEGGIEAPGTVAPGDTIIVSVPEAKIGSTVTAVAFSEPQELGDLTITEDSTVALEVPADFPEGDHRLAIYDDEGEILGWQDVTVAAAADEPEPDAASEPASETGTTEAAAAADDPVATPSPSASASSETEAGDEVSAEQGSTAAPLSVIPPANGGNSVPQADTGGLAVTGPANMTPIIAIVALGVTAGLGLLIVARRDRMDA
ncbi:hypothetical protein [Gulosibacter sediminis]|uniref:hypothetical protein n=1 Tax=Gulosibacter sediminis TaxID=1729695 RepID=UPI0024ACD34F|nr:hypothetical protein [Gulosibacter sediminis]